MNEVLTSVRRRAAQRIRRPSRSLPLVAAAAVSLSVLGVVTPSDAAPTAAAGDEVIAWAEVEDGVISGGPALNSGDHGNFSGTGSYTFRETGMTSTMTVTAPAAGTYPIHVRYAAGPLGAGENVTRSMGLVVNDGPRQQVSYPMTSFGDWETWRFASSEVTLDEGVNEIAIACDRAVDFCRLNFDAIQVGGAVPDPCIATPADPGYTSLFDGTFASFDGWRKSGGGGFGRQTDCTIQSVRGPGVTWLTEQQAAPYTLTLDWRRNGTGDDSSVHVGSSSRTATPADGFRIRIGASDTAAIQIGGEVRPANTAAVAAAVKPVAAWNRFTLQVSPSKVAVLLNGVLVNTAEIANPLPVSGYIGLENRHFTDAVDFRGIQLKQGIDPAPAAVQPEVTKAASSLSATVKPKKLVARKRGKLVVLVGAPGVTPTGAVTVTVGKKTYAATLVNGRAVIKLAPFKKPGKVRAVVSYAGDTLVAAGSTTVKLKVRKK